MGWSAMRTQFPSRVDAWLVALLAGVPLLLIGLGVLALSKSTGAGLVQMGDRGRNGALSCPAPPAEPDGRISRIRLSSR